MHLNHHHHHRRRRRRRRVVRVDRCVARDPWQSQVSAA